MSGHLAIIKLGGSLLTDKSKPYHAREKTIKQIALEIKDCLDEGLLDKLILIFGVGSFGHPPVLEHELHKGFKGIEQLYPLAETQYKVNQYRLLLSHYMLDVGIPIVLLHPSSMFIAKRMRFSSFFLDSLNGFLSLGMVVMMGGDMIFDTEMGFSVGSGDQIAAVLARELNAHRLFFVTDVAGLYTSDPKSNPDAKLLSEVNLDQIDDLLISASSNGKDASGAMLGKIQTLSLVRHRIAKGMDTRIFSMLIPGNLQSLLKGESVPNTRIL